MAVLGKISSKMTIQTLTVTLRDYPTPYHTSWQKIAKHTEIMLMRQGISNLLYCNDSSYHSDIIKLKRTVISVSFSDYEILKFLFQFSCISPKDEELNFTGSPCEYFRDPRMFCAAKVDFDLIGKKCLARRVTIKRKGLKKRYANSFSTKMYYMYIIYSIFE